jgi:ABC-type Fe3+-hydroxamate transport system substrate-binding protein
MRVLSLHPATTELLFAIGAGNMIVARTEESISPDAAQTITSIGPIANLTSATLEILEPDLVLLGPNQELGFACARKTLRLQPDSVESLCQAVRSLGDLLGKQIEADMIVHEVCSTFDRIAERTARFRAHKVMIECGGDPAPGYIKDIVRKAGGTPFEGDATDDAIAAFDPHIYVTIVPEGDERHESRVVERHKELRAIKQERVYVLDAAIFSPTPRLVHGARMLAKILHGIDA